MDEDSVSKDSAETENEKSKSETSSEVSEKFFKNSQNIFWDNEEEFKKEYVVSSQSIQIDDIDILTELMSVSLSGESGGLRFGSADLQKYSHYMTPPDCSLIDITQIKVISEKSSDKGLLGRDLFKFPKLENPGLKKALYETLVVQKKFPKNGQKLYLDICSRLERYPSRIFFNSLLTNSADMKFYGVDPRTVRAISEALERNTNVIELNLQDTFLTNDALYHIGKMLLINKTIRILNLRCCRIGPQGAEKLAIGILENDTLRALDLSYNQLEDSGIEQLKSAIMYSNIRYLNLSFNQIGDLGAAYIGEIMAGNYNIEDLNLSWNFIFNPPGIKELLKGIKKNITIKKFNLSYNAISHPEIGKRLRTVLTKTDTLEYLDLSGNRLNGKTATLLVRGIIKCETLRHIKLGNNPIDPNSALELIRCLLDPKTNLNIMDLSNIWVNKEFNEMEEQIKAIKDCKIIIGGIYSNYVIIGPDEKQLILERATFETMSPKKKKKKRDFGVFILKLPKKPMKKFKFKKLIKKEKLKLAPNVIKLLMELFLNENKEVDVLYMKEYYLSIFPDTHLPEASEDVKNKDKKRKRVTIGIDLDDEEKSEEEPIIIETKKKEYESEDQLDFTGIFGPGDQEYDLDFDLASDLAKIVPILGENEDMYFDDAVLSFKSIDV